MSIFSALYVGKSVIVSGPMLPRFHRVLCIPPRELPYGSYTRLCSSKMYL